MEINTDLAFSVYNLFNSRSNASAYYYTSRLPAELVGGVSGTQFHPLEPVSGVLKVTAMLYSAQRTNAVADSDLDTNQLQLGAVE